MPDTYSAVRERLEARRPGYIQEVTCWRPCRCGMSSYTLVLGHLESVTAPDYTEQWQGCPRCDWAGPWPPEAA